MSTPYERMLKAAAPSSSSSSLAQNGRPVQSARSTSSSSTTPSSSSKKSSRRSKPHIQYMLKPRFRFDLPDPPMDPKMVLGPVSTRSFCAPFVSDIEKDFRPVAVPSDPSYALRVNLHVPATPLTPGSSNSSTLLGRPHALSIDDDALLQSVLYARDDEGGPGTGSGASGPSKPAPEASAAVSSAPWMRRMSYDEYGVSSGTGSAAIVRPSPGVAIPSGARPPLRKGSAQAQRDRRRNQLLASFTLVKQKPTHPDSKKFAAKPVSVMPVFPNLRTFGSPFILLDFDSAEHLTLEHRVRDAANQKLDADTLRLKQDIVDQSVRSLASVSVADNQPPKDDEPVKKYIACYTPTDDTLEKRARKRKHAGDDDDENEDGDEIQPVKSKQNAEKKKKLSKIHLVEDEVYEWISEYVIREGRYRESPLIGGEGERSCFAVTQFESKDRKQRVAAFERIGTSWKLSRKPVDEAVGQLGKEGLELHRHNLDGKARDDDEEDDGDRDGGTRVKCDVSEDYFRKVLCGQHVQAGKNSKKEEDLVDLLES